MGETWVWSLDWGDPLEKGMATHSNILAWRISWTEEPGVLQSTGRKELDTTEWLTLHFHSVQSLNRVRLFATPWTAACQASLSIANSWSLLKLMSIESVMPSNHLILCCSPLFLPSIFPSTRVFSNESVLSIRWPKDWSFSFSISFSKEYSGLISFRMDWLDLLQSKGLSRVFSNTTVQKHQFFSVQLYLWFNSHIHTWQKNHSFD